MCDCSHVVDRGGPGRDRPSKNRSGRSSCEERQPPISGPPGLTRGRWPSKDRRFTQHQRSGASPGLQRMSLTPPQPSCLRRGSWAAVESFVLHRPGPSATLSDQDCRDVSSRVAARDLVPIPSQHLARIGLIAKFSMFVVLGQHCWWKRAARPPLPDVHVRSPITLISYAARAV